MVRQIERDCIWKLLVAIASLTSPPLIYLALLIGNSFTGTIPSDFLRHNTLTNTPVSVGLTYNQLTGTIPQALERFEALSIDLVGNAINGIPDELCHKGGWMGGLVEEFNCDAILCAKGTYNMLGRAFGSENPCAPCPDASAHQNETVVLGSTSCYPDESAPGDVDAVDGLPLEPWQILAKFHVDMAGEKWTIRDGWNALDDLISGTVSLGDLDGTTLNICSGWFGIICNSEGQITDLLLPNNEMYGVVPDYIFSIPTLQAFDISNNNVQMESLTGASKAQGLTSLVLSNVKIQSLEGIGGLTSLQQLLLDGLTIEGPMATELFDLTNLRTLHLQHGHFNGTIPTEIGQLVLLEELNMYGMQLTGTLPPEIGALTGLRNLELSENEFSGSIPAEIRALTELVTLAIHQTEGAANIGGPLPAFDTFPSLKEVNLGYNAITGTIPSSFLARVADKYSEITVSLSFNQIEGEIPASLNSFDKLVLNLEGNKITRYVSGEFPCC